MPKIRFNGKQLECSPGENLRRVLMKEQAEVYNGISKWIHCRGIGTCGTCAVRVQGDVTPMTAIEKWRLSFPPHQAETGLRLACQCQVQGDLEIEKLDGMWGHRSPTTG
ncbi:MAG: 2Fe-2S iron-sulfur cluster-binding protein [Planctomycetota bacterium]